MKIHSARVWSAWGLVLCLLLSLLTLPAAAKQPVPDLAQDGSIRLTLRDPVTGRGVPGGSLTLYQVGEVREEDGNYSFALTDAFTASGESLAELDAALAQRLADFAFRQRVQGTTINIDREGYAEFEGLKAGLYLIVQRQAAEGYYAISPFLVTLPLLEGEEYLYDVDATPKMEVRRAPDEPDDPDDPDDPPDEPEKPKTPDKPKDPTSMPETGDHNRPALWLGLLMLGGAGYAATLALEKKGSKN